MPKVRLLCDSIKRYHPEFYIVLGLADVMPDWLNVSDEPFDEALAINELAIKEWKSWLFPHTIEEASEAIKPVILGKLLARENCESALYFDPGMALFSRLDDLLAELGTVNIGLTSNQANPEAAPEAIIRSEIESLKCGGCNSGFIAVRNCPESRKFTARWSRVLYDFYGAAARETAMHHDPRAQDTAWGYGFFSNGARILSPYRRIYRERPDLQTRFPDPFEAALQGSSFLAWLKTAGMREYPDLLGPVAAELACGSRVGLALPPVEADPAGVNTLHLILETELPAALSVGRGNLLHLSGGCFYRSGRIERLDVIVGGTTTPVTAHSIDRPDLAEEYAGDPQLFKQALGSGFWALARVGEVETETEEGVHLRVTLRDRSRLTYRLGQIKLTPDLPCSGELSMPARSPQLDGQPLVAICMATHNPPLGLFQRQIESIQRQTYTNWICIISDDASAPAVVKRMREIIGEDARFTLAAFPDRRGFYNNFERVLSMAPADSEYIALSDQDDYWYPEKLATLAGRIDSQTMLVYSDMRVVSESGAVLSDTYWATRKNNSTNFCSLAIANSVTGAASLFRSELLGDCLPFPVKVGNLFHDHWIAVMAMVTGKIGYVNEPLYDYVQHGANIIGHIPSARPPLSRMIIETFRIIRSPEGRRLARDIYQTDVLRVRAMAIAALMRAGNRMEKGKRRTLSRLAHFDRSVLSIVWLMLRGLKDRGEKSVTIGAEYHLSMGLLWKHYVSWRSNLARYPFLNHLIGRGSSIS
ncbi:MAG: glycosyltransferase [Blastocatellia bacterium]